MKKKFIYSFIALLIGVTSTNISLSINSDKLNFEGLFSTIEALASGETLPEVDVICAGKEKGWGRCWVMNDCGNIGWNFWCTFTGFLDNYCPQPIE